MSDALIRKLNSIIKGRFCVGQITVINHYLSSFFCLVDFVEIISKLIVVVKGSKMFSRFNVNWSLVFDGLLAVFTIFGFCPLKFDRKTAKVSQNFKAASILLLILSLLHLAVIIFLVYFAFKTFFSADSDVGSFNNILKFSVMALTHFAAIVESMIVRKNFVEIWIRVNHIDESLDLMLPDYQLILKTFYKKTSRKIVLVLLMAVFVELYIIANISSVYSWTFMWSVTIISLMMSRLRHLQHTLYIDMLSCRFQVIKKELKAIVKLTKMENNVLVVKNLNFYSSLFRKLSTIKNVYNTLWETSLYLNRSFGVSQL